MGAFAGLGGAAYTIATRTALNAALTVYGIAEPIWDLEEMQSNWSSNNQIHWELYGILKASNNVVSYRLVRILFWVGVMTLAVIRSPEIGHGVAMLIITILATRNVVYQLLLLTVFRGLGGPPEGPLRQKDSLLPPPRLSGRKGTLGW
jgi:hypothetical protein